MPIEQGPEINISKGQNENVDQEIAPQLEGATDPGDEMLLDGTFCPYIHCTAPPIGLTLAMLRNVGRNIARRLVRHHTIVRNNCTTHGRIGQSNILCPHSTNNGMH